MAAKGIDIMPKHSKSIINANSAHTLNRQLGSQADRECLLESVESVCPAAKHNTHRPVLTTTAARSPYMPVTPGVHDPVR